MLIMRASKMLLHQESSDTEFVSIFMGKGQVCSMNYGKLRIKPGMC